jgi:hypothetical protein
MSHLQTGRVSPSRRVGHRVDATRYHVSLSNPSSQSEIKYHLDTIENTSTDPSSFVCSIFVYRDYH